MAVANYLTVDGEVRSEFRTGDSKTRDYVLDALGSVVEVFQGTSIVADASYKPYGAMVSGSWQMDSYKFRWLGAWGYRYTGLDWMTTYVRARHYSYNDGAWGSVDPLWPGQPAYGYVDGRVTKSIDCSGLMVIEAIVATLPPQHSNSSRINSALTQKLARARRKKCVDRLGEVIGKLTGGDSPWECGGVRECIGQYLPKLEGMTENDCPPHGGGHGFSGLLGLGCCIQVQSDLCRLLWVTSQGGISNIPPCLDRIIREKYNGINPLEDCVHVTDPGFGYCPPGYWFGLCSSSNREWFGCCPSKFVWPRDD